MDARLFRNPPEEYREVPFWSWNDALDPKELVRQVGLMDDAGWGGFFMHARVGLRTPYMGRRWMACVRACVDAARERGMGAWLYDEDRWPSGFAGGLSVAADPARRSRYLVCKVDDRPALLAERIATFVAREVEGRLVDIHPQDEPVLAADDDRLIQFYPQTMPLGKARFNDYAYASLLNPDAVRAFLGSTHEVYAQAVGGDFGGAVPGIFTDEPCFLFPGYGGMEQPLIPWVDGFPALFERRNGYDLLPRLPSLFFDVGDFHAVRYDYWRTVTDLFVESYSKQVYEWCEAHGLLYTGHYMAEDTLLSQILWVGAVMPHYAYMHIPGIDKLTREVNGVASTVQMVKQLDSVVCQTGKARALCENYGCSGQDFAHAGRKWIGDWVYVLGINLNNPHLSLYSMRGERKRDYPQNLFYQQPWWPDNRLVADYFARLSYALSRGRRVVDILVVHPIGSAWAVYRPQGVHEVRRLDAALDELLMALLRSQRDFHLGDEMLMEPGAPAEGRVVTGEAGPKLEVGQATYRLVIVPPGVTLATNTVRLLHEFAAAGGPVLALEPAPALMDGRPAGGPVVPEAARAVTLDSLPAVLDELLPFDVRVPGHPSIWVHHRHVGESECYFLANVDLDRGGAATVQLRGAGRLESWDPATGDVRPLLCRRQDGVTEVVLDFAPAGSHLLLLHPGREPAAAAPISARVVSEVTLGDTWHLALGGPNALTLDTPQVRVGEGEGWSGPLHVLDAHGVVAGAGVGAPFALRFSFDAEVRPAAPIYLVVESPARFEIAVNGRPVSGDDGWWTDISFRRMEVSDAVRAGRNVVTLGGVFARDTELESVYLIGSFGVRGRRLGEENRCTGQVFDRYGPDFWVTDLPALARSRCGGGGLCVDLTAQGLPFFAGRARLSQAVSLPRLDGRTVLQIHGLRAAVAHVRVNGRHAGSIAWPPHRVDVTAELRRGENEIEIELVSTLRNLLGPHHLSGGDLTWTGPEQFRDKSRWTRDYILVPLGFDGVTLRTFGS